MTELSAAELAELAEVFGLGELDDWARIESGTINSNYWIEAGGTRVFVRVNEGKTAADVAYEIALVDTIRAGGVTTPAVLATPEGERTVQMSERPVMLFEWIDGGHHMGAEITAADVAEVAGALARLHRASVGFALRRPGIYRTADIAARFEGFRDSSDPQLTAACDLIGSELEFLADRAAARASLPQAVIHQDLFPDNVLFGPRSTMTSPGGAASRRRSRKTTPPALIDFEQAADGAVLYDLAVLINAWCFAPDLSPDRLVAAVEGFGGVSGVGELWVELRAAAVRFAVTRITDVYLSGLARAGKDFGEFLDRLEVWRQIGEVGLGDMLAGR